VDRLPGGVPKTGINGRRCGAAGGAVARLGDHQRDRYTQLLAYGLAGNLLPRVSNCRLSSVEVLVAGRSRSAVGTADLLSGFQYRKRRTHPGDGSPGRNPPVTQAPSNKESFMDSEARRRAPLEMDSATFRKLGHRLVDQVAGFLESIPHGPVNHDESLSAVRDALDLRSPLPELGMDPASLLEQTAGLLFAHSLFNGHPRFFGYITAPPAPIGSLGDFLAAAVNPNVGAWIL